MNSDINTKIKQLESCISENGSRICDLQVDVAVLKEEVKALKKKKKHHIIILFKKIFRK